MFKRAIYPASFDPITKGHLWMIERGVKLFDELIVVAASNPKKSTAYSLKQRVSMINKCTERFDNVHVQLDYRQNEFVMNFAKRYDAKYILRGMRNGIDFDYENSLRNLNNIFNENIDDIQTIFLMPPKELTETSSSAVRGMIGYEGWEDVIAKFLPAEIVDDIVMYEAVKGIQ